MNIWTRTELVELVDIWKAAYKAAASNRSYTYEDRTLTRQDIPEIRRQLAYLEKELNILNGKSSRGPIFVPARVRR